MTQNNRIDFIRLEIIDVVQGCDELVLISSIQVSVVVKYEW